MKMIIVSVALICVAVLAAKSIASAKVVTIPDVLNVVEATEIDCAEYGCRHVMRKIYDRNNGVVCYTLSNGGGSNAALAISCVK